MDAPLTAKSDYIPNEVLVKYRRLNQKGWQRILGISDLPDKGLAELSIASDEQEEFDPYDTSSRLKKLSA